MCPRTSSHHPQTRSAVVSARIRRYRPDQQVGIVRRAGCGGARRTRSAAPHARAATGHRRSPRSGRASGRRTGPPGRSPARSALQPPRSTRRPTSAAIIAARSREATRWRQTAGLWTSWSWQLARARGCVPDSRRYSTAWAARPYCSMSWIPRRSSGPAASLSSPATVPRPWRRRRGHRASRSLARSRSSVPATRRCRPCRCSPTRARP